jgi:hypothetical protein
MRGWGGGGVFFRGGIWFSGRYIGTALTLLPMDLDLFLAINFISTWHIMNKDI